MKKGAYTVEEFKEYMLSVWSLDDPAQLEEDFERWSDYDTV